MCEHIYPVFYNYLPNVASVRTLCHEYHVIEGYYTFIYIYIFFCFLVMWHFCESLRGKW